jgi:septation ring formation regulator EzrA
MHNIEVRGNELSGEVSGVYAIDDLSKRVRRLESNNQDLLPLIGKMEVTFSTISSDIKEIKGDVKDVSRIQGELSVQLVGFDSRVRDLESIRDSSREKRKAFRTMILSVTATVLGAALVYILKFK